MPEWGEDPLKKLRDIQDILADPLGEKQEEPKEKSEEDRVRSSSRLMLDITQERRALIKQKYNKRISEEQYFKL